MAGNTRNLQRAVFALVLVALSAAPASAAGEGDAADTSNCSTLVLIDGTNHSFAHCAKLGDGFTLAWTVNASAKTLEWWFQGKPYAPWGWAGWGISPTGGMRGSNATVGYGNEATLEARAKPYEMDAKTIDVYPDRNGMLLDTGALDVEFADSGKALLMRGTLQEFDASRGRQFVIWRGGDAVLSFETGQLSPHYDVSKSSLEVDFSTGETSATMATAVFSTEKTTHAWLAGFGFGFLLPLGILVAHHGKAFAGPELAFYGHVALQLCGYALGTAGWGYGMWLRSQIWGAIWGEFAPKTLQNHFAIGTTVFALASLQVIVGFVRPDKAAGTRIYWKVAHWLLGWLTVFLATTNVFLGFGILAEQHIGYGGWRTAYYVYVGVWLGLLILLEPLAWHVSSNKAKAAEAQQLQDKEYRV